MSMWNKPDLAGRIVEAVDLSEDRERLTLRFTDGESGSFQTYGDCCSQTWVEHLTVPPDIKGATVTDIRDSAAIDGNEATPEQVAESAAHREYLDVLRVYQTSIVTDRGEIVIEYRNDSNGYYGGSLDWNGFSS